jgi:CRP/FNR family cyclic AMP-dependent transcriptional regulator
MNLAEILGYVGLLLLLASYAVKTIIWLRLLAMASNVALILYAIVAGHYAVAAIAAVILVINIYRYLEMRRLVGAASEASAGAGAPISVDWLLPYMRPVDVPKGQVLFRKGDVADAMYFISSGRVRIDEYSIEIGKGSLFGEIGIFSTDRIRTATATCIEAGSLLRVSADKVRELYYQNPEFGFFLVGVITRRLTEDLERATAARGGKI